VWWSKGLGSACWLLIQSTIEIECVVTCDGLLDDGTKLPVEFAADRRPPTADRRPANGTSSMSQQNNRCR